MSRLSTRLVPSCPYSLKMTKAEAATFLDVSEKTISRYVSSGKLPARYIAGKTGKQLDFDADELEAFKLESAAPIEAGQDKTTAIVPATPIMPTSELFAEFVRAVVAETGQDKAVVPTADKMLLSLDEASALSGAPRSILDAARKDGRLSARKIGRGYKVQRADLEAFVASLFG